MLILIYLDNMSGYYNSQVNITIIDLISAEEAQERGIKKLGTNHITNYESGEYVIAIGTEIRTGHDE